MVNHMSEKKKEWRSEHLRTVCAFANTYGGRVIVSHSGDLTSDEARKLSEKIYDEISGTLDIYPQVRVADSGKSSHVTIEIKPSPEPIGYNGEYYRRINNEDVKLEGEELESFILLRDRRARLGLAVQGAACDGLDDDATESFCKLSEMPKNSNEELMKELNLMRDGSLNGFAVVMFHRNPTRHILASDIRIGKFSPSGTMDDMDMITGPAFLQPSRTIHILSEKYLVGYEYPLKALEEAIVNAVAHKDYSTGDPIRIRINENSISVSNPGGVDRESLAKGFEGISKPANPVLSDLFFRSGKMRLMGTGIPEMKSLCTEFGLFPPVIEATREDFKITFHLSLDDCTENEELSGKTLAHEHLKSYADISERVAEGASHTSGTRRPSMMPAEGSGDSVSKK